MEITLIIEGQRPLLMHNGRLANPLDPHTRALKALTGKRTKTDEDLAAICLVEARGGCWETSDGLLGIPNAAVWRCIYDAAKAFKRGEDIKRSLITDDLTVPLTVHGGPVSCDDWLTDPAHIDYRPVKISGRKTMRARPRVEPWAAEHTFELLTEVMDPRDLVPILERAGKLVGLGDCRPTYGAFKVAIG